MKTWVVQVLGSNKHGDIIQWLEIASYMRKVLGSKPSIPTKINFSRKELIK